MRMARSLLLLFPFRRLFVVVLLLISLFFAGTVGAFIIISPCSPTTTQFQIISGLQNTRQQHHRKLSSSLTHHFSSSSFSLSRRRILLQQRFATTGNNSNNNNNNNENEEEENTTTTGHDENNNDHDHDNSASKIRLNKVFKATHSRREADALILSGRVSVNGKPVQQKGGFKVQPFVDQIELDGIIIKGWEAMNGIVKQQQQQQQQQKQKHHEKKNKKNNHQQDTTTHKVNNKNSKQRQQQQQQQDINIMNTNNFEYIKYWKPRGITCTTDRKIPSNIIDDLLKKRGYQPKHRVYPVGRLDKDTSGLILLTSDGRLPNSALRGKFKQPKVYQVLVDKPITTRDLQQLRNGVVITTIAQRDSKSKNRGKSLTALTLPCRVQRIPHIPQNRAVTMTLVEGRNRQIRKMMSALGYEVIELHRIQFMGITLQPELTEAGEWKSLNQKEMDIIQQVLQKAAAAAADDPDNNKAETATTKNRNIVIVFKKNNTNDYSGGCKGEKATY